MQTILSSCHILSAKDIVWARKIYISFKKIYWQMFSLTVHKANHSIVTKYILKYICNNVCFV